VNAAAHAAPAERSAPACGDDLYCLGDDVRNVQEVVAAELALVGRLQFQTVLAPARQRAGQNEPRARDTDGNLRRLAADEPLHVFPWVGRVLSPPAGAQCADDVGVFHCEQLGELTLVHGRVIRTTPSSPQARQARTGCSSETRQPPSDTRPRSASLKSSDAGIPQVNGTESSRPHAGQTLPT
jgi:hypothetical protein